MKNKFFVRATIITMLLAVFDIAMFSKGLVNLSLIGGGLINSIASIAIILLNLGVLFAEYKFLTTSTEAKYGYDMEKLKTPADYKEALETLKTNKSPFIEEINRALIDVISIDKKQKVLEGILEQSDRKEYVALTDLGRESTTYLLNNIRRVLNRIQIADAGEWSGDVSEHKKYINAILDNDDKILNEFSKFLTEVSRMDDPNEFVSITDVLGDMVGALKKLRGEEDEVEKKFKNKGDM